MENAFMMKIKRKKDAMYYIEYGFSAWSLGSTPIKYTISYLTWRSSKNVVAFTPKRSLFLTRPTYRSA